MGEGEGGGRVVFQFGGGGLHFKVGGMEGMDFDGGFQKKSWNGGGGCPPLGETLKRGS